MQILSLIVVLGLAALGAPAQETLTKDDEAAAARFNKALFSGRQFPVSKLRPIVKLAPNELRCGDYFVRTYGTSKRTKEVVPVLLYWVRVDGDLSSLQFKVDQHIVVKDNTKKIPTVAIVKQKDGTSRFNIRISSEDLENAVPCLPMR